LTNIHFTRTGGFQEIQHSVFHTR